MKLDKTVKNETLYISTWVLIFSLLMQAVFLIIGKWDYTVLLGNLLGAVAAILNFLLLGITVQSVVGKNEKEIKSKYRLSQFARLIGIAGVIILGVLLPCFNMWAVIISVVFFARIAFLFRPLFDKKLGSSKESPNQKDNGGE